MQNEIIRLRCYDPAAVKELIEAAKAIEAFSRPNSYESNRPEMDDLRTALRKLEQQDDQKG